MASDPIIPSDPEIRAQLERILASDVFATRKIPSAMLRFVVQRTLEGLTIAEKDIAGALFPVDNYAPGSNVARVNANYLRELLKVYNDNFSHGDSVMISFDENADNKGKKKQANYQPRFSYNPQSEVARVFESGLNYIRRADPRANNRAFEAFEYIVILEPRNYEALANLVEICVAGAFFDYPGPANLENGTKYLDLARAIQPDFWRTHAISGALAFAKRQRREAIQHYDKARTANPYELDRYRWYYAFLIASDKADEAMMLLKARMTDELNDPIDQGLYAITSHALGNDIETDSYDLAALNNGNFFVQLVEALIKMFRLDYGALDAFVRLETMLPAPFPIMPGPIIYSAAGHEQDALDKFDYVKASYERLDSFMMEIDRFNIEQDGDQAVADENILLTIEDQHYNDREEVEAYIPWRQFQYALAYIKQDRIDAAVASLMWDESYIGTPLLMFIPLIDSFQCLKDDPYFQLLVSRRFDPPTR